MYLLRVLREGDPRMTPLLNWPQRTGQFSFLPADWPPYNFAMKPMR
jgi:hypothetical protein